MKKLILTTLLSLVLLSTIAYLPLSANQDEESFLSLTVKTTTDLNINAEVESIDGSFLIDEEINDENTYLDLSFKEDFIEFNIDDLINELVFTVDINLILNDEINEISYLEKAIPISIKVNNDSINKRTYKLYKIYEDDYEDVDYIYDEELNLIHTSIDSPSTYLVTYKEEKETKTVLDYNATCDAYIQEHFSFYGFDDTNLNLITLSNEETNYSRLSFNVRFAEEKDETIINLINDKLEDKKIIALINISGDLTRDEDLLLRNAYTTNTPLILSLGLSPEFINEYYEYYLFTIVDSKLIEVPLTVALNNRISFSTSVFGTYAFLYKDNSPPITEDKKEEIIIQEKIETKIVQEVKDDKKEEENSNVSISCPDDYIYIEEIKGCKYKIVKTNAR